MGCKKQGKKGPLRIVGKAELRLPQLAQIRKFFPIDKHTSSHLLQSLLRFTTTRCHWASAVHRPRRADGAEAQSKTLVEKGVGHPRQGAFPTLAFNP